MPSSLWWDKCRTYMRNYEDISENDSATMRYHKSCRLPRCTFLTLAQFHSATKSRSHHRQSSFSLASHPRQSRLFPSSFSFPSSPSHNHDQSWLSEGEPCQSVIIFQSAVLISQLTPIAAIARSFLSFLSFFFSFLPYKGGSVGHLRACVYEWGRQNCKTTSCNGHVLSQRFFLLFMQVMRHLVAQKH